MLPLILVLILILILDVLLGLAVTLLLSDMDNVSETEGLAVRFAVGV